MFQKKPKKPAAEKTQKHEKKLSRCWSETKIHPLQEKVKQGRGNPPAEA